MKFVHNSNKRKHLERKSRLFLTIYSICVFYSAFNIAIFFTPNSCILFVSSLFVPESLPCSLSLYMLFDLFNLFHLFISYNRSFALAHCIYFRVAIYKPISTITQSWSFVIIYMYRDTEYCTLLRLDWLFLLKCVRSYFKSHGWSCDSNKCYSLISLTYLNGCSSIRYI